MTERINNMQGKSFMYMGAHHKIVSITQDPDFENMYKIQTDKKLMTKSEDTLLLDFIPVETLAGEKVQSEVATAIIESNNQLQDLTAVLMDNIEKVQASPEYISQAKSINNSVKNIIDIKRTQIDAVRLSTQMLK